jgi:hypothetical protein
MARQPELLPSEIWALPQYRLCHPTHDGLRPSARVATHRRFRATTERIFARHGWEFSGMISVQIPNSGTPNSVLAMVYG